jgi:hypothetical protein
VHANDIIRVGFVLGTLYQIVVGSENLSFLRKNLTTCFVETSSLIGVERNIEESWKEMHVLIVAQSE